jgi:hypothetical protein
MDAAQNGPTRRIVVRVPVGVGSVLDAVAHYSLRRKGELISEIWNAGMQAVLGRSADEMVESGMNILPRGSAVPREPRAIVELLCGDE